ncbi:MAG: putative phage tail protein, partial [Fimbriimonadales bacterium]
MQLLEALLRSLPPVSYDTRAATVRAECTAMVEPLQAAVRSAAQILVEHDPASTQLSLPDWERVYSLPDPCAGLSSSIERRRADVVAKITARGNLSAAQMVAVAEQLGYQGATVREFGPATCVDPCDSATYIYEDWRFVWALQVPQALLIERATCTSPSDVPLARWGNEPIFCAVSR